MWKKIELSLSNSEVSLMLGLRGHSQGPCGEGGSAAGVGGTSELGLGGGGGGAVSTIVAISERKGRMRRRDLELC